MRASGSVMVVSLIVLVGRSLDKILVLLTHRDFLIDGMDRAFSGVAVRYFEICSSHVPRPSPRYVGAVSDVEREAEFPD